MRRGNTEVFWTERFAEHHRLGWASLFAVMSVFAGALVEKTLFLPVDIFLGLYTAVNSVILLNLHRKFSAHTVKYRRRISRLSVHLFVWGVNVFVLASAADSLYTPVKLMLARLNSSMPAFGGIDAPVIRAGMYIGVAIGLIVGARIAFPLLVGIWKMLRQLFVRFIFARRLQAVTFIQFAAFEIVVVYYSYLFSWSVASLIVSLTR